MNLVFFFLPSLHTEVVVFFFLFQMLHNAEDEIINKRTSGGKPAGPT